MDLIEQCLKKFEIASGQRVSYDKSTVYFSPNCTPDEIARVCTGVGIQQTNDLGKYLRVNLVHGRHSKQLYDNLLDKVYKRLEGLKSKLLSLAGRTTVVGSVLTAMPSYIMQTALLPVSVAKEIDLCARWCVYGINDVKRRVHLLSWKSLCSTKQAGGLGLKQTRIMNEAMLAKLGWRLLQEPSALWSQILRSKYGGNGMTRELFHMKNGDSHIWKGIVKCSEVLADRRWIVGNGRSIRFWFVGRLEAIGGSHSEIYFSRGINAEGI